ncbi:putative GPI-anchor transamidase [Giardia duodenalis]|uniref:GPI-anchor transamidase n=1 Tax=Giardia intestinalis (strain ATCC 50803 / WB clone C6) TaxID=184922 RepID=A8BD30_GIAIC|nr:putative GPI-anchor transamidase [Giardia intestinalis]KAE8304174.1 putative GPI-anchor transamidase [Giardia intestinalis]|eukprot:XP_001707708.1 GPI-anchor transamidase, putative [Giardia lamblia ATCC 50803]
MLWFMVCNFISATTVLLGVDTSRAFWDSRHYVDIATIDSTLMNSGLIDKSILLYANDPTHSWLQLNSNFRNAIHQVIHPHELSPERFLRFLSVELWDTASLPQVDTLVLYFAGHGSPGFIRFQDSSILYKQSLERVLYALKGAGRFTYLCILVDSCHAASFIDILQGESWYVGISSSMKNESSYSAFSDPVTGIPHIDRFSLALSLVNLSHYQNFTGLLLADEFSFKHLLSHPLIVGNGSLWFRNDALPD